MQVYVELALLENFCMDFTLLYCAKLVSKNPAHILRTVVAAAAGAGFAIVMPLFKLHAALTVAIKIISGLIICLISGKFASVKAYFKLSAVFLSFTFVLGGALIAIFSLAGVDYVAGQAVILSKVPIGIPMFCALLCVIAARKIAARLKKADGVQVQCTVTCGGKAVKINGILDSGNRVYYMGQPVSVLPQAAASKIIDETRIETFVKIHTVAGSKKLKIFTADKLQFEGCGKVRICGNVKIAISPMAEIAVIHPDLMGD